MRDLASRIAGLVARTAGALGFGTHASRGERPGSASAAGAGPPTSTDTTSIDRDLRDRERELRILMSNWM